MPFWKKVSSFQSNEWLFVSTYSPCVRVSGRGHDSACHILDDIFVGSDLITTVTSAIWLGAIDKVLRAVIRRHRWKWIIWPNVLVNAMDSTWRWWALPTYSWRSNGNRCCEWLRKPSRIRSHPGSGQPACISRSSDQSDGIIIFFMNN